MPWAVHWGVPPSHETAMTTFLLIRHAINDHVKKGRLAGRSPGVRLNAEGRTQANALAERLADAPIQQLYSSPLLRTMETARAIQKHLPQLKIQRSSAIVEVQYGRWQGKQFSELTRRKLWHIVQHHPSRVQFPEGETLRAVQSRAVDELERLRPLHPRQLIALVSHADVIKLILAHYLGMHLDLYQRISIAPASISSLDLSSGRPTLLTLNDCAHLRLNRSSRSE